MNAAGLPSPLDVSYVRQLQCTRQWRGFLAALGAEFVEALPEAELGRLMERIGTRFALDQPLPATDTLPQLEDAMNQLWSGLSWGQVQLRQAVDGLEIEHRYSPLAAAFGEARLSWTAGFLQGVYQQWFEAAGASGLRVQPVRQADALGSLWFRLAAA